MLYDLKINTENTDHNITNTKISHQTTPLYKFIKKIIGGLKRETHANNVTNT